MTSSKFVPPTDELVLQLARDFDEVRRIRVGDDEIVARASERALAQIHGPRSPVLRSRTLLVAALLMVASGAGAASLWFVSRTASPAAIQPAATPPATTPPRPEVAPRAVSLETKQGVSPVPPIAASSVAPLVERPPVAPRQNESRAVASAPESEHASPPKTAAALFREANAARHAGDLEMAKARYAELQASFPDTTEARTSRVTLGKLLLLAGKSAAAEREFRLYLAASGGALREEAMVGRAEALSALGRKDEERSVWTEILRERPSSVYAARAKQRLEALGEPSR